MNTRLIILLAAVAMAATAAIAADAQPASAPSPDALNAPAAASQPAGESMKVTVVSVTGVAEKLAAGQGQQWTPLQAGEELDELTVIRTGLRTKVVLRFADRGEVTLDRATQMGVGEFRKQGTSVTTRLGLKYGAMHATVDSSRGANDVQVATPVATLSVRGTSGDIGYFSDRGLGLRGRTGTWHVAAGRQKRNVKAGEITDSALTPSIELTKNEREVVLGDLSGGLTSEELSSLINNPSPTTPSVPSNTGQPQPNQVPVVPSLPDDHVIP